jgi:hypothetical protein
MDWRFQDNFKINQAASSSQTPDKRVRRTEIKELHGRRCALGRLSGIAVLASRWLAAYGRWMRFSFA